VFLTTGRRDVGEFAALTDHWFLIRSVDPPVVTLPEHSELLLARGPYTVAGETDLGVLIITHYQRILHLVKPDRVSIMYEGRIVKEGGSELVEQLEREGYGWVRDEAAAAA